MCAVKKPYNRMCKCQKWEQMSVAGLAGEEIQEWKEGLQSHR